MFDFLACRTKFQMSRSPYFSVKVEEEEENEK
jgi:hypothetical protein